MAKRIVLTPKQKVIRFAVSDLVVDDEGCIRAKFFPNEGEALDVIDNSLISAETPPLALLKVEAWYTTDVKVIRTPVLPDDD